MLTTLALSLILAPTLADYRTQFPLPSATVPSGWGVNIHFTDPQPGEMERMKALGIRWARMDLHWSSVERVRGTYDFSAYDRLMASMDRAGIRVMFILDYGNDLYQPGAPTTDTAQEAFTRFARAAVERYRGRGVLWEMWNEPNLSMFWSPKPDPERYMALALRVGRAIRQVAPQEWYIGPATSGFDWAFLEKCFGLGALEVFDAVTVHPYRQSPPETALEDWARLRGLIHRHAKGKPVPLLSGEWGYSDIWSGQSPELKAAYVVRQYLTNLVAGVHLSIYYDWKNDGVDPKEPEHHFGLVMHDLKGKPATAAFERTVQALRGFRLASDRSLSSEVKLLVFQKGKEVRWVGWTVSGKPVDVQLPVVSPAQVRVRSLTSTSSPTVSASGKITFSRHPVVLEFEKPSDWSAAMTAMPHRVEYAWMSVGITSGSVLREWLSRVRSAMGQRGGKVSVTGPGVTVWPKSARLDYQANAEAMMRQVLATAGARHGLGQPTAVTVSVPGPRGTTAEMELRLMPLAPLSLEPASSPGEYRLRNESGAQAVLRWTQSGRSGVLSLTGAPEQVFEVPSGLTGVLKLEREGRPVVAIPETRIVSLWDSAPVLRTLAEGDAKANSEVRRDPQDDEIWVWSTRFPAGWSYAMLGHSAEVPLELKEGRVVALGLEVEGDGSGNALRMRFQDASGQTFQPHGLLVDWKGWKLVRFPLLASECGWWGGAADGVIHHPIRLENLLLIDSVQRKAGETRLRFCKPHLVVVP